jgi:sortase A
MAGRRHHDLRWLERVLIATGIVCLSWWGIDRMQRLHYEQVYAKAFEQALATASSASPGDIVLPADDASSVPPLATAPSSLAGDLLVGSGNAIPSNRVARTEIGAGMLGILEVPRLGLSAPVIEGDDARALRRGAGHLPDTPHPWEPGNSAIAGHRDGLFRPLKGIRVGDEVRVRTLEGELLYRVSDTSIVMPTDLSVLEPTDTQTLTLITCYPFSYIGNAPKRFIVRAERVPGQNPTAIR